MENDANTVEKLKKRWGINFKNAPAFDREAFNRYLEQYEHFTLMRSEVLDEALNVENSLTILILHFVVGRDYTRHRLLRALVFEAEFCSFMQKRKMLSLIFEMYPNAFPFLNTDEAKKIRRELNDLILDRDMFAHGRIFISGTDGKVVIEYYRGGKTATELNDDTLPTILRRCNYLNDRLREMNKFLRENDIDLNAGNNALPEL